MGLDTELDQEASQPTRLQRFRRKLWDAFVRVVWVLLLMFFSQNAVASRLENEPRAALLYWMITAVVVLAGAVITLNRRARME